MNPIAEFSLLSILALWLLLPVGLFLLAGLTGWLKNPHSHLASISHV